MSDNYNQPWPPDDDSERTVVRPRPGGRRPPAYGTSPAAPEPRSPAAPSQPRQVILDHAAGLNPLVSAASPLLSLLVSLRNTHALDDVLGLRSRVEQQIRAFETDAAAQSIDPEAIHTGRYCLCTAVDEAVLNTPWGAESVWREESLLVMFHRERWGGEKFFLILDRTMKDPGRNLHLLELLYLCLALGFQGKYHVLTGGQRTLDDIIQGVYETIRRQRGEFERDLSPHWEGEPDARTPLSHPVPTWVIASIAAALLLSTYFGFRLFLSDSSDAPLRAMAALGREPAPAPAEIALLERPVAGYRIETDATTVAGEGESEVPHQQGEIPDDGLFAQLGGFLKPEIEQKLVEVINGDAAVTIRIAGSGLFASGKDKVTKTFLPRIDRIAEALAEHDDRIVGDITVVGHTDNVPLKRTLRFQDNWHLSRARAASVADILRANKGITKPVTEEGQADTEPLAPNDSRENRALNRRVEILVEK